MPKLSPHPFGCICGTAGLTCQAADAEALGVTMVRTAVEQAAFGGEAGRRQVLRLLGASTVAAALESVFPVLRAQEAFAEAPMVLEKKDVKVGFIPIACAIPILMASPMGYYSQNGLNVELVRAANWGAIRDKALSGDFDAAHMLAPMPIALSMGVGSDAAPWSVAAIQNINGQAITLSNKHVDKRNPQDWRGFKFGVPFAYSMHNYLLRYYLAEAGLDPDKDVQIRPVPPPEMVANLRAGNIDGFLSPDPFNQRAVYDGVGFIHMLSREIWDGHPCCTFAVPRKLVTETPNTYHALLKSVLQATSYSNMPENREDIIAAALVGPDYLNQPEEVLVQVLTGKFPDGLGKTSRVPNRIGFESFPYPSMALWIMTQMKRWGQVKGDLQWRDVAQQVYLAADTGAAMKKLGLQVPDNFYRTHTVMGKAFDPADPEGYISSFPIRQA